MKSLYLRIYATVVVVLLLFALVGGWVVERHIDQDCLCQAITPDLLELWDRKTYLLRMLFLQDFCGYSYSLYVWLLAWWHSNGQWKDCPDVTWLRLNDWRSSALLSALSKRRTLAGLAAAMPFLSAEAIEGGVQLMTAARLIAPENNCDEAASLPLQQ